MKEIKVLLYLVVSRNEGHADKRAFNRVTACLLASRHTNISCFFFMPVLYYMSKSVWMTLSRSEEIFLIEMMFSLIIHFHCLFDPLDLSWDPSPFWEPLL